jgi:hypothetical protein
MAGLEALPKTVYWVETSGLPTPETGKFFRGFGLHFRK